MPAVFVHGVPDTKRVWDAVRSRLGRKDVVTLPLPGFGCPLPAGFSATKEAYVDWLLAELNGLTGPIDIVGHDWGALLVVRAVSLRPDAVRTWAAGGAPLDREYVWHQAARAWQTPGMGEKVMAGMTAETLGVVLVAAGVPEADAATVAGNVDATMKQRILSLYRSAVNVGAEWEDDLRPSRRRDSSCGARRIPTRRLTSARGSPSGQGRGSSPSPDAPTGGSSSAPSRWPPSSSACGRRPSPPHPDPLRGRGDRKGFRRSGASPSRRRA